MTTSVTGACNASVNASGYSPSQWVLGKNLRLPYEMISSTGRLAMQSRLGADKSFAERVSMTASAQRAVLSLKTSTALAKALAARSRATAAQPVQSLFAIGDQCFDWRGASVAKSAWSSRWHGPAVVLGFEANNVWLAHRGHAVKVAARHLRQALPEESVSWEHLYDSALEQVRNDGGHIHTFHFDTGKLQQLATAWQPRSLKSTTTRRRVPQLDATGGRTRPDDNTETMAIRSFDTTIRGGST